MIFLLVLCIASFNTTQLLPSQNSQIIISPKTVWHCKWSYDHQKPTVQDQRTRLKELIYEASSNKLEAVFVNSDKNYKIVGCSERYGFDLLGEAKPTSILRGAEDKKELVKRKCVTADGRFEAIIAFGQKVKVIDTQLKSCLPSKLNNLEGLPELLKGIALAERGSCDFLGRGTVSAVGLDQSAEILVIGGAYGEIQVFDVLNKKDISFSFPNGTSDKKCSVGSGVLAIDVSDSGTSFAVATLRGIVSLFDIRDKKEVTMRSYFEASWGDFLKVNFDENRVVLGNSIDASIKVFEYYSQACKQNRVQEEDKDNSPKNDQQMQDEELINEGRKGASWSDLLDQWK